MLHSLLALLAESERPSAYLMGAEAGILDVLDLPVLVVGRDCKVIRFNHAAEEAFGLRSSDIGRLPSSIQRLSDLKDIERVSAQVMAHGEARQREMRSGDRFFVVRIAAYPGSNRETEGAVLTFTNMTAFRASVAQAIHDREFTKTILNTVAQPLVVLDGELRVQTGNRAFYEMFGVSRETTQGTRLCELGNHDWSNLGLWATLRASIFDNREFETLEVEGDFPAIGRRTVLFDACRLARDGAALILVGLRDITERKQAEDAKAKLAAIVECSEDAIISKDLDGIITSWNRGAKRLFGYTAQEAIGQPVTMLIPSDRSDEEPSILKRIQRGESIEHFETVRRRKDGSLINVSLSASPLANAHGQIVGASKIARDITGRKRSEKFLQLQKDTLEMLVRGLPLADVLGAAARAMEKQSPVEMVTAIHLLNEEGTHFRDCIAPSLPESYCRLTHGMAIASKAGPCCLALLSNRPVSIHDVRAEPVSSGFAGLAASLGIRAAWSTPIIASDGKLIGTVANYYMQPRTRDSSDAQVVDVLTRTVALAIERKKAEAALRESEERYRTLFTSMEEGFCIIEMVFDESQKPVDYRFLEINPAFAQQTGLKDAKGKLMRELAPTHEQHWFDIYGKIALTGEAVRFENRAAAFNRWYEVYAFRVEPMESRRVGIVFNDITERKRQEEKLERTVAERTASLRETVGELEAFSYSIAHDMRAPLRGMQGFARILSEEYAGQLDGQGLEYLRRIAASSRRMDRLIQDVLNYSKIVKSQIVVEVLDLDRLTRDITGSYPDWQPPKAEIQIEGTLPKVLGNEAFLTQCISNLVGNAIKFVSAGTLPRVRIWAEEVVFPAGNGDSEPILNPVMSVGAGHSAAPQVRLYFEDNGIGIAKDKHSRIFRMFERINPVAAYEGTGIGLTIALRAAERMGGSVGFESEPGKGSRFWIQLRKG